MVAITLRTPADGRTDGANLRYGLVASLEKPRVDSGSEEMDNEPLSERTYETLFPRF